MSQRVGYTGGDSENPTYGTVCGGDGHTEAVKIEFDCRPGANAKSLEIREP